MNVLFDMISWMIFTTYILVQLKSMSW